MTPWDSRKNNFDFLRLALAVLVLYSHAYPLGLGEEVTEPFVRATHGQATGGGLAVDSFFIMSGFLICASAQRSSSVWSFLKKRCTRIYPGFAVAALVAALVLAPLAAAQFDYPTLPLRTANFILETLRLREFSYTNAFPANPFHSLNGSVWSIQYEFWCYLLVALASVLGLLSRRTAMLVLFAFTWLLGIAFQLRHWTPGGKWIGLAMGAPSLYARLLPLYLAGMVFYLYRDRIPLSNKLALLSATALIPACLVPAGVAAIFPIAGAYLLFWFAFAPAIRLHRAGQFGDFSYGTYLYAFPIEQLLVRYLGHPVHPFVLFLAATPLTLVAAAASWYGVERHFLAPARQKETLAHAITV